MDFLEQYIKILKIGFESGPYKQHFKKIGDFGGTL